MSRCDRSMRRRTVSIRGNVVIWIDNEVPEKQRSMPLISGIAILMGIIVCMQHIYVIQSMYKQYNTQSHKYMGLSVYR